MIVKIRKHFDSAHQLKGYNGPCSRLHGHRWEAILSFSVVGQDEVGISVDFKALKALVNDYLPDHECLNKLPAYRTINPTAENVVKIIRKDMETYVVPTILNSHPHLKSFKVVSVELFESPECSVVW